MFGTREKWVYHLYQRNPSFFMRKSLHKRRCFHVEFKYAGHMKIIGTVTRPHLKQFLARREPVFNAEIGGNPVWVK